MDPKKVAEALMRSAVLGDKKILATKILRQASADNSGAPTLTLKDAKDLIDTAVAAIAPEGAIRQREALSRELLRLASVGTTEMIMEAARELRAHVETHGHLTLTVQVKHNNEF